MLTKREAIKNFLEKVARPDLAALYTSEMEVQVNVAQDGGELVTGNHNGREWRAWTDGSQTWKQIRIPWNAKSQPEFNDSKINFELRDHADGIGLTGWNWVRRRSIYVAFDFDAIAGHSDTHTKKLSDAELLAIRESVKEIPWVTVRQSTSGNGLHLYVFLDFDEEVSNHTEHAALGRAILGKIAATTGHDYNSKVDACGSNIWLWHRKFERVGGVDGPGLALIKQGTKLKEIPVNWRDHLVVTSGQRARVRPDFVMPDEIDPFEELCGKNPKVSLDDTHKKLLTWLDAQKAMWWFDTDHHMLVAHTSDLARAHKELGFRGIFTTTASGKEQGIDQNCYAFPQRRGAWVVRRHTKGVQEADTWAQDNSGWTRCFLNKEPDLQVAARAYGGVENKTGAYVFAEASTAAEAVRTLGTTLEIPDFALKRSAKLKAHKDGRLLVEIEKLTGDERPMGWVDDKKTWTRVVGTPIAATPEPEVGNYDDMVRHLVSENNADAGWAIKGEQAWIDEPYHHTKLALTAFGVSPKEASPVMGTLIVKPWTLVNRPFQPEYLGNRCWNRHAAQLAFAPTPDTDPSKYQTWTMIAEHCGKSLNDAIQKDEWCRRSGILTGGDYLKLWAASLFQHPTKHLPYLFFYGPQASGKTSFADALSMLMTRGVMRAEAAIKSDGGFNGELQHSILCILEEVDLSNNKSEAYTRIKDWTTNDTMLVHPKGVDPYPVPNTSHWIHCSNHIEYVPIYEGDTRITMIYVEKPEKLIKHEELFHRLRKEAPDFLCELLSRDIPDSNDRFNVPVIHTQDKTQAQQFTLNELQVFLQEKTYPVPGEVIKVSDLHERFLEWLPPESMSNWSRIRTNRELISLGGYVKGRSSKEKGQWFIGNISWTPQTEEKPRLVLSGEMLVPEVPLAHLRKTGV